MQARQGSFKSLNYICMYLDMSYLMFVIVSHVESRHNLMTDVDTEVTEVSKQMKPWGSPKRHSASAIR